MSQKDRQIISFLAGVKLPEDQGKTIKAPTAGAIVSLVRDMDADEMRRHVTHPHYGKTFQANVNAALQEYEEFIHGR